MGHLFGHQPRQLFRAAAPCGLSNYASSQVSGQQPPSVIHLVPRSSFECPRMLGSHSFCFLHVRSLRLTHVEAGDSRRRPTGGTFSGTATPFGLGAGVASSNPPLVFLNTIFQNHRKHVFILHKIIYNQRSFTYWRILLTIVIWTSEWSHYVLS